MQVTLIEKLDGEASRMKNYFNMWKSKFLGSLPSTYKDVVMKVTLTAIDTKSKTFCIEFSGGYFSFTMLAYPHCCGATITHGYSVNTQEKLPPALAAAVKALLLAYGPTVMFHGIISTVNFPNIVELFEKIGFKSTTTWRNTNSGRDCHFIEWDSSK